MGAGINGRSEHKLFEMFDCKERVETKDLRKDFFFLILRVFCLVMHGKELRKEKYNWAMEGAIHNIQERSPKKMKSSAQMER